MLVNDLSIMIAYLKDELKPEEESAVEKRLADDETYAWVMECLHQNLFVEDGNEPDLKELEKIIVQESHRLAHPLSKPKGAFTQPVSSSTNEVRSFYRWIYPLVAAAALVLVLILIRYQSSTISDVPIDSYLVHYEDQIAYKGTSTDFQMRIDSAITYYRVANVEGYHLAIPLLKKVLQHPDSFSSSFDYEEVKLIYGISLLQAEDLSEAIDLLSTIVTEGGREQKFTATWYLALTYYAQDQSYDLMKTYFEDLAHTPNPYQEKAQAILQRLNSAE